MVGKKNDMLKNNKPFPLKKVLIAFSILLVFSLGVNKFARGILWDSLAVFTLPSSEHNQENPTLKKETITVTTDQDGVAESASSSVYITNNKEQDVLIDQSSLTNIQSSASKIVTPKVNKKTGEVKWTLNKKDVSYTGYAEPNDIPVKMDVKYYLDGKRIDGEELAGKTGKLKIDIKYTSTQTVDVDNRASKVPYVVACVATFDGTAKNIKVKGGSVAKSKQLSIAAGLAFPGWEEVLGKSEVGGIFTNKVVITADVKKMSETEIISAVSPDLLEGLTNGDLDAINADNAMTLVESYTKAAVAAAQNISKALIVADTKVVPMVKTTVAKMSEMSKEIVKSIPEFFKTAREATGKLQATTNMYFYFTNQIKTVLEGEKAISKTEIFDDSFETYMVALRALNPEVEGVAYNNILDTINDQYGAHIKQLSIDLVYFCKRGLDYEEVLNRIENNIDDYGDNYEKIAKLAKVYSEETINLNNEEQYILVKDACGEEIADVAEAAIEGGINGKKVISKLLISLTPKGGEYAKAMSDQDKLDEIGKMYTSEWLKNAVKSGDVERWMDEQKLDSETKAIYMEYIEKAIKDAGENPSIEDMSKMTPKKVTEMFNYLNKTFDEKNQKSVTNKAAQISKGIQTVDNMTGKVGVAVHKISNVAQKISSKLTKAYNGAISKIFKMYNKNIRGLTDNLKKIKKVDDKAGVFSGMTDEMQGSTTYMFYTPVASKTVNVNKEILDEENNKGNSK